MIASGSIDRTLLIEELVTCVVQQFRIDANVRFLMVSLDSQMVWQRSEN